jgi:L-asparagine transporter-like permease
MNLIILTAVLSCLNSGLYVTSRVLFTLAARGDAPAVLVKLNDSKVPVRAILFATAFAIVAGAASVVEPTHVWAFLLDASGALMLLVYGIVALAQIRLRKRLEAEAPERLLVRMWFYPYGSWFTVAAILAILAAMAFTPSLQGQLGASLVVLAIALGAFFILRRATARTVSAPPA